MACDLREALVKKFAYQVSNLVCMVCMVCNVVCMISTHLGFRVGLWGLGYGRLVLNVFSSKRLYYM